MKIKLFNFVVRTVSVAMFSFAVFLPIVATGAYHSEFTTKDLTTTMFGAFCAGLGYGAYRFLQEINKEHDNLNKENSKIRYNINYEHTTINIKERATL